MAAMSKQWPLPEWREQGRTGPGGPRYKKLSDRNKVRRGKPVGKDQFGDGGTRRIPAKKIKKAKKKSCCSMVEAGRAAKRRKFRLARRYAVHSIRHLAARFA